MENLKNNEVFTETKDLTLSVIKGMVEDGDLITNPDYQRDFIYSVYQSSGLIESLLMNIPIPVVYLSEENDGTYTVIDGQQRLTSFTKFLNNEFELKNLKIYGEFNNNTFSELPKELQRKLKSSTIRAVCFKKECNDLKYEVFARLNQGSKKVTSQEIRNCLYRGSLNTFLHKIVKDKTLSEMFIQHKGRMAYEEYILRFLSMTSGLQYKSSMTKTLNNYMEKNKDMNLDELKISEENIREVFKISEAVLGKRAFCSYSGVEKTMDKFNAPVYDSIVTSFFLFNKHDIIKNKIALKEVINDIKLNDRMYHELIFAGTSGKFMIIKRIMKIYFAMCETIGNMGEAEKTNLFLLQIKKYMVKNNDKCKICGHLLESVDNTNIFLRERADGRHKINITHINCDLNNK